MSDNLKCCNPCLTKRKQQRSKAAPSLDSEVLGSIRGMFQEEVQVLHEALKLLSEEVKSLRRNSSSYGFPSPPYSLDDGEGLLDFRALSPATPGDFAEWFRSQPGKYVRPGDIVELDLTSQRVSTDITWKGLLFVVSTDPAYVGSAPRDRESRMKGVPVACCGKVSSLHLTD